MVGKHVTEEDQRFMQMAVRVAEAGRGQTSPNPLVGAVIVKDGFVVGIGAHLRAGTPHAEVHALRAAGDQATGATAYVTLEPCSHFGRTPPCADALIEAGIQRVVIAGLDNNPLVAGLGVQRLQAAGIEVTVGVESASAPQLNEAFFTWIRQGRPYVVWKSAATVDGYTACPSGHSQWVTGPEARAAVQRLRLSLPAIAVGVGTVLADDPALTARSGTVAVAAERQPLRVVFDTHLRTPATAHLLAQPGRTRIYVGEAVTGAQVEEFRTAAASTAAPGTVEVVTVPTDANGHLSLVAALQHLGQDGISGVLVEGGSTLVGTLLQQRLVDAIVQFTAPKLLGGGIPLAYGCQPQTMAEAILLEDVSMSQVGSDWRMDARLVYPAAGVAIQPD